MSYQLFCLGLLSFLFASGISYAADTDVVRAFEAYQRKDVATLSQLAQTMQNDRLAMYPEYFLLNLDLENQPFSAIDSFTRRYDGAALSEKLLGDWLEAQAQNGNFATARPLTARLRNPDRSEACAIAVIHANTGDPQALSTVQREWMGQGKQPETCQQAATLLARSALTTEEDRWTRLNALLRQGRVMAASELAMQMGQNLPVDQLTRLAENPDAAMSLPVNSRLDQSIYGFALARLADQNLDSAFNRVLADQSRLSSTALAQAYRILAMESYANVSRNGFDDRALNWFRQSAGVPLAADEADAYARLAVRAGSWPDVLKALDALPAQDKQERVWRYWFARASENNNQPGAQQIARTFYSELANDDDYYGLLARERLGRAFDRLPNAYQPNRNDLARADQDVHFQRAMLLRQYGLPAEWSNREWNWGVRMASVQNDDAKILAAAQRAQEAQWFDRSIHAADKAIRLQNSALRFQTPFRDTVVRYSQQVGLDPAWAYGLMRQESRFVMNARSSVGAGGLMQVMPDTAKWIARRLGEPYSPAALSDMNTNIRYGTFYLSHVLEQLGGQPVLATAGYNAGPNRAKRWQGDRALPVDQYTDSIPFLETRDYVKQVMTNAMHYGLLFNQQPQSITQRMGHQIPPRSDRGIVWP